MLIDEKAYCKTKALPVLLSKRVYKQRQTFFSPHSLVCPQTKMVMNKAITFLFGSCLLFSIETGASTVDVADFVNQWHNMMDSVLSHALLPITPSRCLDTNNVNLTREEWTM